MQSKVVGFISYNPSNEIRWCLPVPGGARKGWVLNPDCKVIGDSGAGVGVGVIEDWEGAAGAGLMTGGSGVRVTGVKGLGITNDEVGALEADRQVIGAGDGLTGDGVGVTGDGVLVIGVVVKNGGGMGSGGVLEARVGAVEAGADRRGLEESVRAEAAACGVASGAEAGTAGVLSKWAGAAAAG